jgi:hypothetical protein
MLFLAPADRMNSVAIAERLLCRKLRNEVKNLLASDCIEHLRQELRDTLNELLDDESSQPTGQGGDDAT